MYMHKRAIQKIQYRLMTRTFERSRRHVRNIKLITDKQYWHDLTFNKIAI